MPRAAVQRTAEFERIASLPRRPLMQEDADAWAAALTPDLLCRGAKGVLRPWQAYGLAEAAENGGAWLAYPVGVGKTLIAELAPVVMGARRAVLIIPASLRDKTMHDRAAYRGTWRIASPPPTIITLESLAVESGAALLEQLRPDLIVIDECDELANPEASAVARIDRYVRKYRDHVDVIAMTGTPSRHSIMGYWHIVHWCLRDAPLPCTEGEAKMWDAALGDKAPRGVRQPHPGPLGATRDAAREWYRKRLSETPGIVIVDGDSAAGVPLTIRVRIAKECPELNRHFERFLVDFQNPAGLDVLDGETGAGPLSRWRTDSQMGAGYYQYFDPPPPAAWVEARRTFARFIRHKLEASRSTSRPLDTMAQVVRRYRDAPEVVDWLEIRDTFKPITRAAWLSGATIESAIEWLAEDPAPGIVWCGGVEFAEALAEATGLSYYARQGKDARGRGLYAADPRKSLIASWHANKRGFNLQAWRRMLIVQPPQSAKWLEQVFGRTHRAGQDKPVTIDILATSGGTLDAFDAAIAEAQFARGTVGLTQKILRAEIVREEPRVTAANKYRWARRDARI